MSCWDLPWTYAAIRGEIKPYPNKHCLGVLLPGQEDEATNDTDKYKWDEDKAENELGEESDAGDQIEEFCPEDWVAGAAAEGEYMKKADTDAQDHGNGADAQQHGDGATPLAEVETVDEDAIELTFTQSKTLRLLRDADVIFKDIGGIVGASLRNTLANVVHKEGKSFAAQMKHDPKVTADLARGIMAEEAHMAEARVEFKEQMNLKRENTLAKKALADIDRQLKKRKKDVKHQEAVMKALAASRAYSLAELGHGNKKGGTKDHIKTRSKLLDQVREVAELSPEQIFHWSFFKSTWDVAMMAFHKERWPEVFAQMVQKILKDLLDGQTDALSVFVEAEKARVLGNVAALVIPLPGSM